MESETINTRHRDDLVRSLKQFSLSYQQHQLIHSSDFGPLVSDVQAKRRVFTIVLMIIAVLLAYQTVRSLLASSPYLHWLILSVLVGLWIFRRYTKMSRLVSAYGAYLGTAAEAARCGDTLASELKLGFKLAYSEHQAIRADQPHEAARQIIARRKANSKAFAIGVAVLTSGAIYISEMSDELLTCLVLIALLWTGLAVCLVTDRVAIRKIERLLERYPEQEPQTP